MYERKRLSYSRILSPRIQLKVKVKEDYELQNPTTLDACSINLNLNLSSSVAQQEQGQEEMIWEGVSAAVIASEGRVRL